jgi:DNA-directed RNA polymerase
VHVSDDPVDELVKVSAIEERELNNPTMVRMERYVQMEAEMAKKNPMRHASVTWTTPIGLPVCQPYRDYKTKTVSGSCINC